MLEPAQKFTDSTDNKVIGVWKIKIPTKAKEVFCPIAFTHRNQSANLTKMPPMLPTDAQSWKYVGALTKASLSGGAKALFCAAFSRFLTPTNVQKLYGYSPEKKPLDGKRLIDFLLNGLGSSIPGTCFQQMSD